MVGASGADAQSTPQRPHARTSVRRSTSQPLRGSPSQSAKFSAQTSPQRPATQLAAVALMPTSQRLLHAPQWAGSVRVFTSQPLVVAPSQLA